MAGGVAIEGIDEMELPHLLLESTSRGYEVGNRDTRVRGYMGTTGVTGLLSPV